MKNLKLKVWNPNENRMITNEIDEYISFDNNGTINNFGFPKSVIPLLFTGLKDRKSKEIYEGDILYYADDNKKYEVVYSVEQKDSITMDSYIGAYFLKDIENGYCQLICSVNRPYRFAEIIGNKFENPELLK